MRAFLFLCALSAIALVACGGGAGGASTSPSTSYTVSLGSTLVLYDEQFLSPDSNVTLMQPSITPALSQPPSIVWSTSSAAVVTQQTSPNTQVVTPTGFAAATAPPGESFVFGGTSHGAATVQAQIGSPVNQTATVTVYYYPSISLGCRFRYTPAFSFDPGNTKPASISSDLYDTIASDQIGSFDGCGGTAFATAPGTAEMWHAPYGGTFIAGATLASFPAIAASSWQNNATSFAPAQGVLLFKTQGGLIVKALLPIGPYEASNASGVFPY